MLQSTSAGLGLYLAPAVIIVGLLTVVPVILLAGLSLTAWSLVIPDSFRWNGFGNYLRMLADQRAINAIKVSFYYILVNTALQMVVGFMIAYLLHLNKRGTRILRPIFLIPMLIPPVVVGLCWRILFTPDLGGINYFIGLIGLAAPDWLSRSDTALIAVTIASLWEWSPFVMVVLLAGLESLPSSPMESGRIDGASAVQMVFYIVLPLLKPVLLTVTMLRIIEALGILPVVFMMTGGGPASATEAINLYAFEAGFSFLDLAYSSSLLVLFSMLIFLFSLGFLRKSLAAKGMR